MHDIELLKILEWGCVAQIEWKDDLQPNLTVKS